MTKTPTISWWHFFIAIPLGCLALAFYFGNYYKNWVTIGPFIWTEKTVSNYTLKDVSSGVEKLVKSGLAENGGVDWARLKVDPDLVQAQLMAAIGPRDFNAATRALKKSFTDSTPVYYLVGSERGSLPILANTKNEDEDTDFLGVLNIARVPQEFYLKEGMYPLSKKLPNVKKIAFEPLRNGTVADLEEALGKDKKHPDYIRNMWEVFHYKLYFGFIKGMAWNFTVLVVGLVAALLVFIFWKSPFLFLGWWWIAFIHLWVERVLYWPLLYMTDPVATGMKVQDRWDFFVVPADTVLKLRAMYFPNSYFNGFNVGIREPFELFWLFLIFVVGPCVLIFVGYEYLVKHFIPRHKRFIEDFFKVDKDAEARKQLSIEDVEFTHLGFDLKKKLAEYKALDKEKESLFLGMDDKGVDVSLPIGLANQHIHILGPTGCGKTALAIMPIGIQVIARGYGAAFVDFKGDYGLIQNIAQKCKEEGKRFYYFSINPSEKSEAYNPLASGNVHSKVDRLINALKLDVEGPASYYTNMQRATLLLILQGMIQKGRHITIKNVLIELGDESFLNSIHVTRDAVSGLYAKLLVIKDYPMINEDGMVLKDIMDENSVVYFNLNSQIDSTVAEAIGRMLIIDLKSWAAKRNEADNRFFIFIDEFQTIASDFFIDVISKVRSANYCLVLANQARSNLINVSQAFHDVVMINSYTKIIFTCPTDAKFWAFQTGTTRIDDYTMRTYAGSTFGDDHTALDGRREKEGSVMKVLKPLFTENVFMKLPLGKSIIFITGPGAKMVNHSFYSSKEEFRKSQTSCFAYDGGKFYGDPSEHLQMKNKEAQDKREQEIKDNHSNEGDKGHENDEKENVGGMGGVVRRVVKRSV